MQSLQNYNTTEKKPDDQFDITGKRIAFDLRSLDQEQLVIAEKISETIYYAKLKKLNENYSIKFIKNSIKFIKYRYLIFRIFLYYLFICLYVCMFLYVCSVLFV